MYIPVEGTNTKCLSYERNSHIFHFFVDITFIASLNTHRWSNFGRFKMLYIYFIFLQPSYSSQDQNNILKAMKRQHNAT